MKILSATPVYSRPLLPTHYEMELIDVSKPKSIDLNVEISLHPKNTFERRAINTVSHQIDKYKASSDVVGYYDKVFVNGNGVLNYSLPTNVIVSHVFDLTDEKIYKLQFSKQETKHLLLMLHAYKTFIQQEKVRDHSVDTSECVHECLMLESLLKEFKRI